VLSYIEPGTPAFYHAAPSLLNELDRVQSRLLRELGLSELDALARYKLAPLSSRRDMAMLGLLHRVVLGEAPQQLADLFPFSEPSNRISRLAVHRHDHQFVERQRRTDLLKRSLFGLVSVYN
jgi:hypothetical protein